MTIPACCEEGGRLRHRVRIVDPPRSGEENACIVTSLILIAGGPLIVEDAAHAKRLYCIFLQAEPGACKFATSLPDHGATCGHSLRHPGSNVGSVRGSPAKLFENAAILQNLHNVLEISPLFIAKPALSNFRIILRGWPVPEQQHSSCRRAAISARIPAFSLRQRLPTRRLRQPLQRHEEFVQWASLKRATSVTGQRLEEVLARHKPRAILHFAAMIEVGSRSRTRPPSMTTTSSAR